MLTAARPVAARFLLTQSPVTRAIAKPNTLFRTMGTIADGVEFDTIAREWRCKWSADGDKASLVAAQKLLSETLPTIKAIDGVKGVQRIVCGGCLDFKVITALDASKWGDFESGGHGPEAEFLEKLKAIDGITEVETQTYTIMPM